MESLPQRVIRKLREQRFARAARAVRATAPIEAADDGVVIFSMIGTRVVDPYLIDAGQVHYRERIRRNGPTIAYGEEALHVSL